MSRIRCGNSRVMTPFLWSRIFIPRTKPLRSGTWARTLLPMIRSALLSLASPDSRAISSPKKSDQRRNAFLDCRLGHIGGGLNSQNRNALSDKELEQIAVVAGNLDNPAFAVQAEPLGNANPYRLGHARANYQSRRKNRHNRRRYPQASAMDSS